MLYKFPNLPILTLVDLRKAQFCARNTSFLRVHTLHLDNLVEGEVYVHSRAFAQLGYLFNEELFMLRYMRDIEVLWPKPYYSNNLRYWQCTGSIKCRLLVGVAIG